MVESLPFFHLRRSRALEWEWFFWKKKSGRGREPGDCWDGSEREWDWFPLDGSGKLRVSAIFSWLWALVHEDESIQMPEAFFFQSRPLDWFWSIFMNRGLVDKFRCEAESSYEGQDQCNMREENQRKGVKTPNYGSANLHSFIFHSCCGTC